ncbi:MAG: hypothetical protein ABEJ64_03935 [Candidatus Nanohaloarchaea archaeon]
MRKFTVLIDQSGKIEDMSMDTGMAFSQEKNKSDEVSESIHIKKEHKSRLKPLAKEALGSTEKFRLKLFACGIFMLTQNYVGGLKEIVIDQEYEGKDNLIETYLGNFYENNMQLERSKFPKITVDRISSRIEGTPECHDLAYRARELSIEPLFVSNYKFLKGMVLPSPGKGRKTN